MVFSEKDVYTVRSDSLFGDTDKKVINYLYQPLIGVESVGVYYTLWNELDHYKLQGNKGDLIKLIKILRISMEKFAECLSKIEAVGLLRTYSKVSDGKQCLVFELFPPLSPASFEQDEILSSFLKSELGEERLEELLGLFKKGRFNRDPYKERTHSFDDVFGSFYPGEFVVGEGELLDDKPGRGAKVRSSFDMDLFLNKIKSGGQELPEKHLTEEVLQTVENLYFVYQYDEMSMAYLVNESYVRGEGVDLNKMREKAGGSYLDERGSGRPAITEKNKVRSSIEGNLSEEEKEFLEEIPYKRLKRYFVNGVPPHVDLKVLDKVLNDIKLEVPVLNVLIDYILRTNDSRFTEGYVLKVASEWKRAGIKTVQQAVERAKNEHRKKMDYQKRQEGKTEREKVESKPDWVQKEESTSILTEEELARRQAEIDKMLE